MSTELIRFEWKITSFAKRSQEKCIVSSDFTDESNSTSWNLEIYPNGISDEHAGYVSIYLVGKFDFEVYASYIIYLKNRCGGENELFSSFRVLKFDDSGKSHGCSKFAPTGIINFSVGVLLTVRTEYLH